MANLPKVVTCKRKVNLEIIVDNNDSDININFQGCGKCLYCLKIMVLCECSEKDKVRNGNKLTMNKG